MLKKILTMITCLTLCACSRSPVTKEERTITKDYPELNEDTLLFYGSEERVIAMLQNGIGVVFFGDATDEESQKAVITLNEVAEEKGISVLCYDIAEEKEKNSEFYTRLLEILNDQTQTEDSSDLEEILVPSTYFVSKGSILSVSIGTDSKEKYSEFSEQILELQSEEKENGCDSGCEVTGPKD